MCTFGDVVMTTMISVYVMSFVLKLFYGLEYRLVVLRSFVKYNEGNGRLCFLLFVNWCEGAGRRRGS